VVTGGGAAALIVSIRRERSWGDHCPAWWRPAFLPGIGRCHDPGSVRGPSRSPPSMKARRAGFHPAPHPFKTGVGHWVAQRIRSTRPRFATAGLAPGARAAAPGHPTPAAARQSSIDSRVDPLIGAYPRAGSPDRFIALPGPARTKLMGQLSGLVAQRPCAAQPTPGRPEQGQSDTPPTCSTQRKRSKRAESRRRNLRGGVFQTPASNSASRLAFQRPPCRRSQAEAQKGHAPHAGRW